MIGLSGYEGDYVQFEPRIVVGPIRRYKVSPKNLSGKILPDITCSG